MFQSLPQTDVLDSSEVFVLDNTEKLSYDAVQSKLTIGSDIDFTFSKEAL